MSMVCAILLAVLGIGSGVKFSERINPQGGRVLTIIPGTGGVLRLTAEVNGQPGKPTVIRADHKGDVVFSGGVRLEPASFRPCRDASFLARLEPSVRSQVRSLDVSRYLPSESPELPDQFPLPPGPWLHINGRMAFPARWPNADAGNDGWATFTKSVRKGDKKTPGAFLFTNTRPQRWRFDGGVWLYGYWTHDWSDDYLRVASWTNGVMELSGIHPYGIGSGTWGARERRFFAFNVAEELDAPGEWYLDRNTGVLHVIPPSDWESSEVVLAVSSERLLFAEGLRHVRFENLEFAFSHGMGAAVSLTNAFDVAFTNCTFRNFADAALHLQGTCISIRDCRIVETGGKGVFMEGGDRDRLIPSLNLIDRCDISRTGLFRRTYHPCVQFRGAGAALRRSRLHDVGHAALFHPSNENLVFGNEIFGAVRETGDAGAVYKGRNPSGLGNALIANYVHDLGAEGPRQSYVMGMYFDDCDWGDAVIANTYDHAGKAIFIGGGDFHPLYYNLIRNCAVGVHWDERGGSWRHAFWNKNFRRGYREWCECTIKPNASERRLWHVAYPGVYRRLRDRKDPLPENEIVGNVMVDCDKPFSLNGAHTLTNAATLAVRDNIVFDTTGTHTNAFVPAALPGVLRVSGGISDELSPAGFVRLRALASGLDSVPETELWDADGRHRAIFGLDVTGRLSWRMETGGRPSVMWSQLGVSVDERDYGRLVILDRGKSTAAGVSLPLRSLFTGNVEAFLEARFVNGRLELRYRVPGKGRHLLHGEMTRCRLADGRLVDIGNENDMLGAYKGPREFLGEVLTDWIVVPLEKVDSLGVDKVRL